MDRAPRQVASYVARMRWRAVAMYAMRALCGAAGLGLACLTLAALVVGPVSTPATSALVLSGLGLAALGVAAWAMAPARRLRGPAACRLIAAVDPALASRARSVLELATATEPATSPELVAAHARAVEEALSAVPPAEAVPISGLRHRSVGLGLLAAAIGVATLGVSERARDGAEALLHPATLRGDGLRLGAVVSSVKVRAVYPSYLARDPEERLDDERLELPRGTTVEIRVAPRLAATTGRLRVAGADVRLDPTAGGELFARFVVRRDGPIEIRLKRNEHWYVDDTPRVLIALPDHAPEITIESPAQRAVAKREQVVPLRFRARDDGGIASVELVVRTPDGEERRRRLWSSLGQGAKLELSEDAELMAAEFGAADGDVLLLWLEASDADVVSGPNVGHSATVTLEVASAAQELSLHVPRLQAALDEALMILADRLELPIPEPLNLAQQRFGELEDKTTTWLANLSVLIEEAESSEHNAEMDVDQLQGIVDRTGRLLRGESAMYQRGSARHPRWASADARMVEEHEKDVLLLADLLAQALVDEARALTGELSELRQEISDLLEQMKNAASDDAKRALLSRIARAQRRLQDLAASLARLSTRVPAEFINREALPQTSARSSLEELRRAVESDDLSEAMARLEELARQIDSLAEQVEQGGARFRESHFGGHDAALAEAQKRLQMLGEEQGRLAGRTGALLQQAGQRARSQGHNPKTEGMQRAATDLQRRLDELDRGSMSQTDARLLDRARDRLRDTRDALRTGDVSEARRMSAAAERSLDQAASNLEADARMYPGHGGRTWQNAERAADAMKRLDQLRRDIEGAAPRSQDYLNEGERARMRSDVMPQREARNAARSLADELGESGDDRPLSPQGQKGLEEVQRAMQRAEQALERGDAQEAASAQEDASERIDQLAEDLKQRSRGERSQGEGRDGEGSDGQRVDGKVRIPGADEFSGPVEMRRRLLDAMRESPPPGFESSVERYYRELLK